MNTFKHMLTLTLILELTLATTEGFQRKSSHRMLWRRSWKRLVVDFIFLKDRDIFEMKSLVIAISNLFFLKEESWNLKPLKWKVGDRNIKLFVFEIWLSDQAKGSNGMCVLGNGGRSCLRSVLCAYFKVCRCIHSFHCQTQQAIQLRMCKEMPNHSCWTSSTSSKCCNHFAMNSEAGSALLDVYETFVLTHFLFANKQIHRA